MNWQQTLTRPAFLWSASAIAITTLVTVALIVPVIGVLLQPGAGEPEVFSKLEQYQDAHTKDAAIYEARVKGRYLFSSPPPPPREDPPEPVVRKPDPPEQQRQDPPEPQEPTGPPPPPPNYQGPPVRFVVGETVFFEAPPSGDKPFSVSVGHEMNGVKVISTDDLPRSVRLGFKGGEYDVDVFENWNAVAMVQPPDESDQPEPVPFLEEVEIEQPQETDTDTDVDAGASAEQQDADASEAKGAEAAEAGEQRAAAGPNAAARSADEASAAEPTTQPGPQRSPTTQPKPAEADASRARPSPANGKVDARDTPGSDDRDAESEPESEAGESESIDEQSNADPSGPSAAAPARWWFDQPLHARLAMAHRSVCQSNARWHVITSHMMRWPVAM